MLRFYNIKNYIQKTFRFGWFIPFSNLLIVYGRYFLPYKTLKSISDYRNNLIEGKISSIVGDISYVPITMTSDGSAKIWVLWLQGEEKMPLIPKLCLASIRKYSGLHEVVLLSWETLDNYVKLPSRIKELYDKGNISAAHLSDIIRIHLLCTYGGFWIDSTVMLTSPLSEQIFSSSFYTMKSKPEGFYVSECRWSGFCLYMSKNHPLAQVVNSMLQNYWEKENWLIDYFMLDYLIDIACKTFPEIKPEFKLTMQQCRIHC